MRRFILGLAASLALAGPAAAASVGPYTSFIALGDSLTDPGRGLAMSPLPGNFPYVGGRFSNGPVWAEIVAEAFAAEGRPSLNLAIGGATAAGPAGAGPTPLSTLAGQIGALDGAIAGGLPAGDDPLVAVWFGANDIFQAVNRAVAAGGADFAPVFAAAANAASLVGAGAREVARLTGADEFALFNLPDLGAVPLFRGTPLSGLASSVTAAFNAAIAAEAAALRRDGLGTIEIDFDALFTAARADPGAFGFTNVTDACILNALACAASPGGADDYLFVDLVHPNRVAHAALAELVFAGIEAASAPAPIPLPATAPLALLGLAGIGLVARRRAA